MRCFTHLGFAIAQIKSDEDCKTYLKELKMFVDKLKEAETNPIQTAKRILEDGEKYKDMKW